MSPSLPPKDGAAELTRLSPELGSRPLAGPNRPWWRSLKGPIAVLLTDLADPTPMVRRRAAEALARLGDRRAASALAICARDPAWEVRKACVKALDRLGGDGALKALHRAGRDGHAVVRLAAAEAIGRHGDASSLPVLKAMLDYAERYGTAADRVAIAEALAQVEARVEA
ncbi:MAG: HEAT repeat domain-containing protein [Candidatus Sericytochromatia bacterium]